MEIWQQAILNAKSSIQDAVRNLDEVAIKIVLIVDEHNHLLGTVSDGDIRRGLLKGLTLASPIIDVVHRNPLVVPTGLGRETVMQLMTANKIQQIPVVDESQKVIGLHLWDEITTPSERPNVMVIMAGGKGTRLMPHTQNCPKPMVLLAGKPMLEHIIERAKAEGFRHFVIAVHHLGHMIEEFFGNGSGFDVQIDYLKEPEPLGTAGALAYLPCISDNPFIVTNGDVITDIRYGDLLDFHIRHAATATMSVRIHEWQHPFGVVQTQGVDIIGFEEKPVARTHINAGVYALNQDVIRILKQGEYCDMPTLFQTLQNQSRRIVAFPMHEPWLDVGRPDDLKSATESINNLLKENT